MSTRVRDDAYLRPNTKMTYVVSSQNMGCFQAALILFQLIKKKQGKSPKGSFIIPQGIQARHIPHQHLFRNSLSIIENSARDLLQRKESQGLRQESDGAAALVQGTPLTPQMV